MELLQTVLAFTVVIGVLVTIHEYGHYLVARWCDVKVLRFSVGMGKVIWSRRFGPDQTEWAISAVPLGGYVKMLDARDTDAGDIAEADLPREFTRQSVWKRIAIVSAGPLANFLLAIAIFTGLYSYGIPEPVSRIAVQPASLAERSGLRSGDTVTEINGTAIQAWSELRWHLLKAAMNQQSARVSFVRETEAGRDQLHQIVLDLSGLSSDAADQHMLEKLGIDLSRPPAVLGKILPGGPASAAGLKEGDRILRIEGLAVVDAMAFIERLQSSPGQPLIIEGLRHQQPFSVQVTPVAERVGEKVVGRIMAQIDLSSSSTVVKLGPWQALTKAVNKTWDTCAVTLTMLGKMLMGQASLTNITGPLTIADYAGQTARVGMISFLTFMAFISISLGVMNLLPIPVLDGGHLLYYSLELFSGRPVSERAGQIAQRAGIGILMALMAVALFNDIVRLVR